MLCVFMFFFFKQKPAYEMRISDWSSDVCSSDLYAPDYVINAGGIINVALEYLGQGSREEVESRIRQIPDRLADIWAESRMSGTLAAAVADRMAQKLIGRG